MNKTLAKILCAGMVWLAAASGAGAQQRYLLEHFTMEDGLPQSTPGSFALDRNGFLWIATQAGICRFDGRHFVNFTSRNSIINSPRIVGVTRNEKGLIEFCTSKPGNFLYYVDDTYRIRYDSQLNKGAYFFREGYASMQLPDPFVIKNGPGSTKQIPLGDIQYQRYLYCPLGDQLYYFDRDTLLKIDLLTRQYKKCLLVSGAWPWIAHSPVGEYLFIADKKGDLLVWKGDSLLADVPATTSFRQLQRLLKKSGVYPPVFVKNSANSVITGLGKQLWIITEQNGILDARLIFDHSGMEISLGSVLYDEERRVLFIGATGGGLYMVRENPFNVISFDEKNRQQNDFYNQLQVNSRTAVNRAYSYNPVTGAWKKLPRQLENPAFCKTADGRILYASQGNIYIADTNMLVRHTLLKTGEVKWTISCLMQDRENRVWFITDSSIGRIENNRVLPFDVKDPGIVFRAPAESLFDYSKDSLWICTTRGLVPLHKTTGKAGQVLLRDKLVRYVYRSPDGSCWISTYGSGIYRYRNGTLAAVSPDVKGDLLFAHSVTEDSRGFFWIPTNNGLFQCKKEELEAGLQNPGTEKAYYYKYKKIGAYNDEFNLGVTRFDSLLLLSMMGGVLSFDPERTEPLLPDSNILVESITSNGVVVKSVNDFVLPPGFQRLEVIISAPYFGDPVNNILEYQLKEVSQSWYLLTDAGNKIIYNTLPAGTYHLTVRKRVGFGHNNYAFKTIVFTVKPYWYQTIWAWIAAGLLAALLVFFLKRRSIRQLIKKKAVLENKVQERTEALNAIVEELDVSEKELNRVARVQEQALAIILHDIRSPLHFLSLSAKSFQKNIDQLSSGEIKEYAGSLVNSTGSIDKFSNDLTQWLNFNRKNYKLNNELIDLGLLMEEIRELYAEIAALKNNRIILQAGEAACYVLADRNRLSLVIRNLVDNANKYCQEGEIILSAEKTGTDVIIRVSDTGDGMSAEKLKEQQQMGEPLPDLGKGKLGLRMVYHFIQLMKGRIAIGSEAGKGTTVEITLPAEQGNV